MEEEEKYSPPSSYHGNMKKKKNNKNKRRFTDEQIKLMETIFESESKLEPRKKLQVAKELGLHPRQVAIWFQNKRARWKSKQVEHDYNILKASYDNLAYKFQSLKEETQSLLTQLHKLKDQVEKPRDLSDNCIDAGSDRRDIKNESQVKPDMLLTGTDARTITSSTDGDNNSFEYLDHKEFDLMNVAEHADDGVLTSPENWCSLDSSDLFDQSCSSSQWWEFWP